MSPQKRSKTPSRLLLDVMNATCRLAEAPERWLSNVGAALAPVVDRGVGVQTFGVSFGAHHHQLSAPLVYRGTSQWNTVWMENWWKPVVEPLDSPTFRAMFSLGPFCSAQELWDRLPARLPAFSRHFERLCEDGWSHALRPEPTPECDPPRLFYVDSLNLFVHDEPSGEALCVVANRPEVISANDLALTRRNLTGVVPHLRAGLRIHGRLRTRGLLAQAEAIFRPDGSVVHATGCARARAARRALRDAVRRLESVRAAKTDAQVDDALRLWPQLSSGHWDVIDAFDSDGRRYLVALPKEVRPTLASLSPREQQVVRHVAAGCSNKEIAWELGLSTPTVATLLSRGARKLGVASRVALVRLVQSLDQPD